MLLEALFQLPGVTVLGRRLREEQREQGRRREQERHGGPMRGIAVLGRGQDVRHDGRGDRGNAIECDKHRQLLNGHCGPLWVAGRCSRRFEL
jgi:hypothetical protein